MVKVKKTGTSAKRENVEGFCLEISKKWERIDKTIKKDLFKRKRKRENYKIGKTIIKGDLL